MRFGSLLLGVLVLISGPAFAAGPFDGTWTGESPPGPGRNGCPANEITAKITDGKLLGEYQVGRYTFHIRGTVGADGKLTNGFMANIPLEGAFSGGNFEGSYQSKECNTVRKVTLHKTG
ncbi:MAG TPA: hypothetical protein VMC10_18440 [Stellaceae bacterium]|nr:hypothetical protein [Stellaceae bacterium]